MNTWYCRDVGDGVAASGVSLRVQNGFTALVAAGGIPEDAAVFLRHDLETNVVTVYFTPSASILADTFGARPCEKPTPERGLSLLAGTGDAWETHFPGHSPSSYRRRG